MTDLELIAKVHKQLQQQITRLKQIQTIMEQELIAIRDRNGDKLLEVAQQKELQLTAIRNADAQFQNDGAKAILQSDDKAQSLRSEIETLLHACQQQNEINYLTATQNQIAIEQVKGLLLGGTKNTTYDAYGKKHFNKSLGTGIKA